MIVGKWCVCVCLWGYFMNGIYICILVVILLILNNFFSLDRKWQNQTFRHLLTRHCISTHKMSQYRKLNIYVHSHYFHLMDTWNIPQTSIKAVCRIKFYHNYCVLNVNKRYTNYMIIIFSSEINTLLKHSESLL